METQHISSPPASTNGKSKPKRKSRWLIKRFTRSVRLPKHQHLERVENSIAIVFSSFVKLAALVLILGFASLIYKGLKNDSYTIEAFSVPDNLEKGGYNGLVVAHQIQDEVNRIKEKVSSIKEDSVQFNEGSRPEMNIAVMGFGVSLQSITYYSREIFGKKNKSMAGEITYLDSTATIKLRITDYSTEEFQTSVVGKSKESVLKELISHAAQAILKVTDPYRLALHYYQQQKLEKAQEVVSFMLTERPEEKEWAYLAWGGILERQQKYELAAEKYRRCTEINPHFELGWLRWGLALRSIEKYEEAIPKYKRAISLSPHTLKSDRYFELAWLYEVSGNYQKADSLFEYIVNKFADGHAFMNWAEALSNRGDTSRSPLELYYRAYRADPNGFYGLLGLAGAKSIEGKDDSVVLLVEEALIFDPQNVDLLYNVGSKLYRSERYIESIPYLRRTIKAAFDPEAIFRKQQALNLLAMCKYQILEYDSALHYANEAIAVNPSTAYPYSTLAEAYAYKNQFKPFYEAISKAVSLGFQIHKYYQDEPYDRYVNNRHFRELVKQSEAAANP